MRTERYHVCFGCFARQVRLGACVRCGSPNVANLRDAEARARVLSRIDAAGRERAAIVERSGWELQVILAGVVVGGVALGLQMALEARGAGFVAALVGVGLFAALVARWHAKGTRDDAEVIRAVTPRLECVDRTRAAVGDAPQAIARVQGRVRVTRPVEAPVSGRACAAARVTGMAFGAVDDAVCGAFELVDAHGAVVARFDGTDAAVDIPTGEPAVRPEVMGPLRAFLDERLVFQEGARVSLDEALLVDGDLVTLEGPAEDGIVAEGYRESRTLKVFRGTSEWPVVLRLEADEARVRVAVEEATEGAEAERRDEAATRGRR